MARQPKERLEPVRCPTCGALVYGDCIACMAKKSQSNRWKIGAAARGVSLGVDLHGEARKRYEELRRKKEAEANHLWKERSKTE